jgi:hypothetical protein
VEGDGGRPGLRGHGAHEGASEYHGGCRRRDPPSHGDGETGSEVASGRALGHESSVAAQAASRELSALSERPPVTGAGHPGSSGLPCASRPAIDSRPILPRPREDPRFVCRRRRNQSFLEARMQGYTSGREKNPPSLATLRTWACRGGMHSTSSHHARLPHTRCLPTSLVTTGPAPLHISCIATVHAQKGRRCSDRRVIARPGDHSLLSAGAMPLVDRRAMTLSSDWRCDVLVESCSPQQFRADPANEFSEAVPGDCSCPLVK